MKLLDFCKHGMYMTFGLTDEKRLIIFSIDDKPIENKLPEKTEYYPLQIRTTGTDQNIHHGAKHTGGDILFYKSHEETEDSVTFILESELVSCKLVYKFYEGTRTVTSHSEITNISSESVGLEYVSSLCLYGIDPKLIHIPHNAWCREFDIRSHTPEELGYSKTNHNSTKRIVISNSGTWPTKEYLPMGAISEEGRTLLWQIEHNGSWNYEISEVEDAVYIMLSGPSEQENHWWKNLLPGETFTSVNAALTVISGDMSDAVSEMTKYRRHIAYRSPADRYLPVIFNDYMNCLYADPYTDKLIKTINAAADAGAEIYCMDAGWYAEGSWWDFLGEWEVCENRFTNGMKEIFDLIRDRGMVPGIWLEPEGMGIKCPILDRFDDSCFFMRHGKRVIDHSRYQLDFRNKQVIDFMDGVVDRLIKEYGIGYFKFDYNVDAGIGTETDADSFGDGLKQSNDAYIAWLDRLYERYPDLIIEACASGGMRMEYKTLSHTSLCSLTDAWLYEHITPIACNSQFGVIPEQAGVWCVPMCSHGEGEIAIDMVNSMFKRMHLSGETHWLNGERLEIIHEGVEFYKSVREHITKMTPFYPCGFASFQSKTAVVGYKDDEKAYLLVTNLDEATEIFVPLDRYSSAEAVYPKKTDIKIKSADGGISVAMPRKCAVVLELK